jgi:cation transport protein ChaC
MWQPGFVPDAFEPARLDGWHRRFCIVSRHYRGTPERPGLVLGLAPGGHCVGRAIGVGPARAAEVLDYLDAREHVGGIYVYDRVRVPVRLTACGRTVEAWTYTARTDHADYAGGLGRAELVAILGAAAGASGSNRAYVQATVAHLAELGIVEPELAALAAALGPEPAPA